jgi:hypothetical protein
MCFLYLKTIFVFLGQDERQGHRYNPNPSTFPWTYPRPGMSSNQFWWFEPYFFFNFFSNIAHCCILSGSLLLAFGILLCLPQSVLAFGTFLAIARSLGLRFGPILICAASLGFLMLLPSAALVLLSTWIFFRTVLMKKPIFNHRYFARCANY